MSKGLEVAFVALVFVLAGVGAWHVGKLLQAALAQRNGASRWHAIGADRLELGATGYWIKFDPRTKAPDFTLVTPEGHVIGQSMALRAMKELGEAAAAQRAEFRPGPSAAAASDAVRAAKQPKG